MFEILGDLPDGGLPEGRMAINDFAEGYVIVGDSQTGLVAGLLGEPDYDDAEIATRYLVRVQALTQQANILATFGNHQGRLYRVRVVTAVPSDGLTRWDRGEEVTFEKETRVLYDPAARVEEGEEPVGAELEVIEVSGDTEDLFIGSLVQMGLIERA